MANQYSADVPKGFNVPKQVRLDSITGIQNELTLKDLGDGNNLAFKYYEGLKVYCKDEKTEYVWREVIGVETGLLDVAFTYPTYSPIDGINYSGKSFNFFEITNSNITPPDGSETKLIEGTNITITGTGTTLDPYEISADSQISQTYINEGDNINITGNGTQLTPYIINADLTDLGIVKTVGNEVIAPAQSLSIINNEITGKVLTTKEYVQSIIPLTPDGSETKLLQGTNITITGLGTTVSPYIINSNAQDDVTYINQGNNVSITGNGTIDTPYIINSTGVQFEDLSNVATSGKYSDLLNSPNTKVKFNTELTDGDFLFVGDITQYTNEQAQDAVGNILIDTPTINFNYDDDNNTIIADVKPSSINTTHLANNINVSKFINDSDYATKAYADSLVTSVFRPAGDWDASGNTFPITGTGPGDTIRSGDTYNTSVVGTPSGFETLDVGDNFYALIDNPGQTPANWKVFESNTQQATESFRGTAKIATQATIENVATTNNIDIVTPSKFYLGWEKIKTVAQTFAAKITFTTAPRFNSTTANTVPYIDSNKDLVSSTVTPTELGHVSGVTSAIQTQINSKENTSNKQNSLAVDGTDTKYPTVTAVNTGLNLKANLASPTFTGTPTAPTATAGTNTTQIATTAFVAGGLATKENTFSKNTAFNKPFGITAGTVAEGNDSRILNGQTAFGWGNHASAGYALTTGSNINQSSFRTALGLGSNAYTSTPYLPLSGGTISGNVNVTGTFNGASGTFSSKVSTVGVASVIESNGGFNTVSSNVNNLNTSYTITNSAAAKTVAFTAGKSGTSQDGFGFNNVTDNTYPIWVEANGSISLNNNTTVTGSVTATSFNGSATLTGTPTAPTAPVGATGKQIANLDYVQANARPYKVYTALLSQTGTNAPTAIVLENTLGGTVVWSYVTVGLYNASLTGAFANNKTACYITRQYTGATTTTLGASRGNDNFVGVVAINSAGAGVDSQITNVTCEIRVYN